MQLHQQNNFYQKQLFDSIKHYLVNKRNVFAQTVQQLDDYSPLKTLDRGYVYVTNLEDKTVSSVDQISENEELNLHFKDGQISAVVKTIRRK